MPHSLTWLGEVIGASFLFLHNNASHYWPREALLRFFASCRLLRPMRDIFVSASNPGPAPRPASDGAPKTTALLGPPYLKHRALYKYLIQERYLVAFRHRLTSSVGANLSCNLRSWRLRALTFLNCLVRRKSKQALATRACAMNRDPQRAVAGEGCLRRDYGIILGASAELIHLATKTLCLGHCH